MRLFSHLLDVLSKQTQKIFLIKVFQSVVSHVRLNWEYFQYVKYMRLYFFKQFYTTLYTGLIVHGNHWIFIKFFEKIWSVGQTTDQMTVIDIHASCKQSHVCTKCNAHMNIYIKPIHVNLSFSINIQWLF